MVGHENLGLIIEVRILDGEPLLKPRQPIAQLVERLVWDQEAAGSNPAGLTIL